MVRRLPFHVPLVWRHPAPWCKGCPLWSLDELSAVVEIGEAASRLFSCIIAEGVVDVEWLRHGGAGVFDRAKRLADVE